MEPPRNKFFLVPPSPRATTNNCPRRVLAQTAKTRGGTLESPAYREENYGVPEKISIFENTARKGLPKVRWGSNKQAKDSGSVLYTTRF